MKTPAPQRAAGRRKLAAKGQTLPGTNSFPTPNVAYWHKALQSVGRVPAGKRAALASYLKRRARQLGITSHIKGTWLDTSPAKAMAGDSRGIELAMMMRRVPVVRGMADVQASRTGPSAVSVMHKSSGIKIGSLVPAANGGYQGVHADGTKTPASGSMSGAMAALVAYHNKQAAQKKLPPAQQDGTAAYANGEQMSLDLAGALPHSTPASSSSDGPRVTSMGAGKKAKGAPAAGGMADEIKTVYAKLIKKGMKPAQAMALAKRAASMHQKAQAKAA
jgi:hypothetical protein